MKISLNQQTINDINHLLSEIPSSDHELEFRIGYFKNNKFVSGVNKPLFTNLLNHFISLGIKYETINSKVSYYDNDIRRISEGSKVYYQYKKKIHKDIDIAFSSIDVRISSAIEKTVSEKIITEKDISKKINYTRIREKNVFYFDGYNIELSSVSGISGDSNSDAASSYEIEVEFTYIPKKIEDIIIPLKKILSVLYPNKFYMIPKEDEDNIRQMRKDIHTKTYKPVNIKRENIPFMKKYSVTNKLNGIGYELFISQNGIYIINNTDIDKISSTILTDYIDTIIEGELYNNIFNVFDVLVYKGTDISNKPHNDRLSYMKELLQVLNPLMNIEVKTFIYTENLANDTRNIMRYMENKYKGAVMESNDGIMFTPENGVPLKYKFPTTMTIDFEITNEQKVQNGKTFTIRVYDSNNRLVNFDGTYTDRSKKTINLNIRPLLFVSKTNPLYNLLTNGLIVESLYNKDRNYFIPERIRWDKNLPNFIGVAIDVFRDIIHPIKLDELIDMFEKNQSIESISLSEKQEHKNDCLFDMRKFHNRKKDEIISKYTSNKTVLDLGFGRGGDLLKYTNAKASYIWAVEPNIENLDEAKRRYNETKYNIDVKFINCKAQESVVISKAMNNGKADIVSSFFSLTFFFENENELNSMIDTIASNIKTGGYFIGTTMDGDKAYEEFKNKTIINHPGCYKIVKHYLDDGVKDFGKKITIHLDETIVSEQDEYLVFFELFKEKLEKRGLYLVESSFFDPPKTLSDSAYNLSKLNMSFVFEKKRTLNEIKEAEIETTNRSIKEKERLKLEEKNKLKMIDMDKNVVFNVSYLEYPLIRTGTIGDGSCFFHAVMKSIYPNYSKKTENERREMISKLRLKLSDSLSLEQWESLGNGLLSYMSIIPKVIDYITNNFSIEISNIAKKLDNIKDSTLKIFHKNLISSVPDEYKEKLDNVFNDVKDNEFKKFKNLLKDCKIWVGQEEGSVNAFEYLSNWLNIDIYILKDTIRAPYKQGFDCNIIYKGRQSILVLWVEESHYEAVCIMTDGKIKRVFNPDDDIIKITKKYVC